MFELLFRDYPALFIPCLAIAAVAVVGATWLVMHYTNGTRRLELETALKQDLLNRGLSPEEIERIVMASSRTEKGLSPVALNESMTPNEYALVEKMLHSGHSIEEIERVIRAFKGRATGIRLPQDLEV